MKNNYEHLKETVKPDVFTKWQEVDVVIYAFTDLGMNVAINDEYIGLIYRNQIYDNYKEGQKLKGYVKNVREDGKIDISLQPERGRYVFSTSDKILEHLKISGGKSMFNDKSSPEDIKKEFQVSKKVFKQAIGKLYKLRKIRIMNNGIELVE
ncbi:MAG: type I-B CRISPR-associated protein Cas8b1/Cst1 [Candidatus Moranbacteria bacterium]|nr:type I-B CRISPR-associated protein Cas8b1/Cst1 [Candidatus Moranbacteria bacterium]